MTEQTFSIREAVPTDADQLLSVMSKIGSETPYLVMDERGMAMSTAELAENLATLYESPNNVLLVALAGEAIIGTASVSASSKKRMEHIGEIGISILKQYWGYGLGSILMEELIRWAHESHVIRRLELKVQDRNQRAIHVYKKLGFETEAIMPRGAKTDQGEFLDVHLMRLLID